MFVPEPSINLAYYGPSPQPSAMRRAQPEQPKATVNLQIIPVRVLHATYSSRVRRSPKPPSRAQPVDTGPTRRWGNPQLRLSLATVMGPGRCHDLGTTWPRW